MDTDRTSLIKPGILVALKSTVTGGVAYKRVDLETGEEVSRWETTRTIDDPAEHDRATKCRSAALSEIRKVCSATTFGLLCPEGSEADLDAAIARARSMVKEYNDTAMCTTVHVYALKGRIASTDEEAARAIGEEVRSLVESMSAGIDKLDPKLIRDAANRAKELSAMLDPKQAEKVSGAIEQARRAARMIVKRVEKEGEAAAIVLADIQRGQIDKARIAFLDLSDTQPAPATDATPVVNVQRFADLDVSEVPEAPEAPESSETCPSEPDVSCQAAV